MKKSKKGIWIFLLSLIITFTILGSIFMLFFLYKKTTNVEIKQDDIAYDSNYKSKKSESMSMVIIACEKINLPPQFILLLNYDAPNSKIYITVLPPNAVSTVSIREDTIIGHYDYEGIRGGVNAVKSLLLLDVDRYARLDRTGVANLVDFLGGIEFDVKEEVVFVDAEGNKEEFFKGKQLLDGRRVSALLFNKKDNKNVDIDLQLEISTQLFNQKFNNKLSSKLSNFVSAFFYNAETNMNQYDFAIRQKGLEDKLKKDAFKIEALNIDGEYVNEGERFLPNTKSIETISNQINNIFKEE